MPFETTFEEEAVYWRFFGTVTFADMFDANKAMWNHPRADRIRFQVVDFLDAGTIEYSDKDAVAFSKLDDAAALSFPEMRVAIIAVAPDHIELCRAYIEGLDAKGWRARVFSERDTAISWARGDK